MKKAKYRQTTKQFSLKDELFNQQKVRRLAREIKVAYPEFKAGVFEKKVLEKFPQQELMERVRGIRDQLRIFLPQSYKEAVTVIIKALPPELDTKNSDNDFGDFIYAPYSYFVATYGCTEKHVAVSLAALREITKRFSAEGALRDFLNAFPEKTLAAVYDWSRDSNYHVRRLASEGTRPYLPWAKKVHIRPDKLSPVLDRLHKDRTRYVVRSVANHLNDLTKIDKKLVLKLLKKWNKEAKQTKKELDYLTNHALRSLIRAGDTDALRLIGYASKDLVVSDFGLVKKRIKIGEALQIAFRLQSVSLHTQNVMVDYLIYFNKANGQLATKTYKLTKCTLAPGAVLVLNKKHLLKLMSTRTLYPGKHKIELQINGHSFGKLEFILLSP